ncbi:MAG: hypothetical protein LBV27_00380 [Oscillospiraceae bacterium]|jgi:predicted amidohydrolase|nr:hypothetical protein [Oscillospiraceae bacterium]
MSRFKMPNIPFFFSGRVSPREIAKIIDRLDITPSGNLEAMTPDAVGVAAIQLLCKRYASLADYIIDMNLYVEDAVNRHAQIIVFPAYTGLLPFTVTPQFEQTLPKLRVDGQTGMPDVSALNECLSYFSDYVYDIYYNTMSMLAARHQVYIMAGTTLYFEDDELRHRAFLFDDGGDLVGYQDKVGLNRLEQELAVEEAGEIKVFDTAVAPVSILIGSDVDYYETARISKGLGAKIMLNPTLYMREYTPVDDAAGLNLRVQETHLYGVQSVMVGDSELGFVMEGPSCIYAPNEMIRAKNGVLEKSSGRYAPDILCRRLNLDRLETLSNPYTKDVNTAFMERYVDRLY